MPVINISYEELLEELAGMTDFMMLIADFSALIASRGMVG
jgi:hypothetical protein